MSGTKSSKFKLVMNILDANSSRGLSDQSMEIEKKKKDRLGLFEKQWQLDVEPTPGLRRSCGLGLGISFPVSQFPRV